MGVNEEGRRQLAHLLRQLVSGELRTKDYDDRAWSLRSEDPAINAIRSRLWFFYSDWMNMRFKVERLPPEPRAMIDRSPPRAPLALEPR